MDDRFNTIAGWVLFAGIVALGSSIVASEVFHSERPEKMGYPIEGVAQEGEGEAAAEQPVRQPTRTGRPGIGRGAEQTPPGGGRRQDSLFGGRGTEIIGESRQQADARQMNQLAPLPKLMPELPPGTRVAEFEITWRVELTSGQQADQTGGGS